MKMKRAAHVLKMCRWLLDVPNEVVIDLDVFDEQTRDSALRQWRSRKPRPIQ
jgi:hypothetical protein